MKEEVQEGLATGVVQEAAAWKGAAETREEKGSLEHS